MNSALTPARRLLAILEEEQALETRPLDEVLADLEAHGVDAAGPTRLARRLAEQGGSPAAALLGAVIEDEAAEAEIAALESADIDDVRGRLDVGTVAALAAEAERRAGKPSNVVGLRRRRSPAWAWAGSLVGMAACALVVVAVWWPSADLRSPEPSVVAVEVAPAPADAPSVLEEAAAPPAAQGRMRTRTEPMPAITESEAPPDREPGLRNAAPVALDAPPDAGAAASAPAPPSVADGIAEADEARAATMGGAGQVAIAPPPPPTPAERQAANGERMTGPDARDAGDWVEELQRAAEREDAGRGLSMEALPMLSSGGPVFPVTDGVVYPQAFGWDLGEAWSDGAFPVLQQFPDDVGRDPVIALAADPQSPDSALEGFAVSQPLRPLPLNLGSQIALGVSNEADSGRGSLSLLERFTLGLYVMLADAELAATGPWSGDVANRLPEARRLVEGRPILALLTVRLGGVDVDTVLLVDDGGDPVAPDRLIRAPLARWFGDHAEDFAHIVLPIR